MCGIIGAVGTDEVINIIADGLQILEYRGYDSSGIGFIENDKLSIVKSAGKVSVLKEKLSLNSYQPIIGIGHTRWATHGSATEENSHPHVSRGNVAIVHNGIIENHVEISEFLKSKGYIFLSTTDSEVISHLLDYYYSSNNNILLAIKKTILKLVGSYAVVALFNNEPEKLFAFKSASPIIVGLGENINFVVSDVMAIEKYTNKFIFLENDDILEISKNKYNITNVHDKEVTRDIKNISTESYNVCKGHYRHFMLKEINEQTTVIQKILRYNIEKNSFIGELANEKFIKMLQSIKNIHLVACGTSYNASLIAKYWIESITKISCIVEVASEYRYRDVVVNDDTLMIVISQSGETADTLAALNKAKSMKYNSTLSICNVTESSIVRDTDFSLIINAGREVGVASTKAFTGQLLVLMLLALRINNQESIFSALTQLPIWIEGCLNLDQEIQHVANDFVDKKSIIYLGRGLDYPIAKEGALKLKELSYIHAEGYPAGELKHGPLALVDEQMPVIAIVSNTLIVDKVISNLIEIKSRGGKIYIFTTTKLKDKFYGLTNNIISIYSSEEILSPILFAIPMQLLAYHIAVLKGTDVDQPRNLAKSVTVE